VAGCNGAEDRKPAEGLRLDKRQFIRQIAKEANLPLYVAAQAYEAFVKTLLHNVREGAQINLTGFGKFYWQRHAGHKVQFGGGPKDDYTVLKFSATRQSNEFLDLEDNEIKDIRVPGTRLKYSESAGALCREEPANEVSTRMPSPTHTSSTGPL